MLELLPMPMAWLAQILLLIKVSNFKHVIHIAVKTAHAVKIT
jgi:hypothetical protein